WRCAALLARSSAFAAAAEPQSAVRDYTSARLECDAVADVKVRERVLANAPILMAESSDRDDQIIESIDFVKRTQNRIWLPSLYLRLGKIRIAAGDAKKAENAYRTGIDAAQSIAASVTDPWQRESFQRHVDALFASLAGLLVDRGALMDALQVTEQGRGRDLA